MVARMSEATAGCRSGISLRSCGLPPSSLPSRSLDELQTLLLSARLRGQSNSMGSGAKAAEPRRPVPRLYLVAPAQFSGAVDVLEEALSAADIAAVLLRLPHGDGRAKFDHVKAVAPSVQGRCM